MVCCCSIISELINKAFPGEGKVGGDVILPSLLVFLLHLLKGAVFYDLVSLRNLDINNSPAVKKISKIIREEKLLLT